MKQKPSESQLNSTEREMKQYFYLIPKKKKKTACLGETLSLFCVVTWWVDWQVLSEV